MNSFTGKVLKKLYVEGKELCFSPYGLYDMLTMILTGSNGDARIQLLKLLEFPFNPEVYCLKKNMIIIKEKYQIKRSYLNEIKEICNPEIMYLYYYKELETIAKIKEWVKRNTGEIINNFDVNISPNTKVIFLNALYFFNKWKQPFDTNYTVQRPFYKHDKTVTLVETMCETVDCYIRYCEELQCTVVMVECEEPNYGVEFIVPDKADGISDIINVLPSKLHDLLRVNKMKKKEVYLMIPKIYMSEEINFRQCLTKLGCLAIFEEAGLLKIADDPSLSVSDILQKTVVVMDEKGASAACVTETVVADCACSCKVVHMDRPFLCVISEIQKEIPLFVFLYQGN